MSKPPSFAGKGPEDPGGAARRQPGPLLSEAAPRAVAPNADGAAAMGRLRAWLCRKNPRLVPDALDDELDLIDSGVVDSFALVELILLIEQECGRRVLSEELDPRSIRTLGAIERTFFARSFLGQERP